ncbi:MAG: discoidin domain-containing protein, partial [Actinomyces sp.]
GYTEQAGEEPLEFDPTDNRLPLFPATATTPGLDPDDTRTVSEQRGPVTVRASAYGNPVTYTNDDRPVFAVDGDPTTAWTVAAFSEARGEYLRLDLPAPRHLDHVTLLQPPGPANRHITEVTIRTDDGEVTRAALDERSLVAPGQTIPLDLQTDHLEIVVTDTDVPRRPTYPGVSPVGFAEVDLGLGPVVEVIRTPRALLDRLGDDLDRHDLTLVFTRERTNPREPVRDDPEAFMRRSVALPTPRTFELAGTVRLSAAAAEPDVDAVVGRVTDASGLPLRARSSGRLAGDLPSGASSAFDGDPTTAWTGVFGPQVGQWVRVHRDEAIEVDGIALDVVVDADHSVPTAVRVVVDGADHGEFPLDLELEDRPRGSTRRVTLPVRATGRTFEFRITAAHERLTRDWYSATPIAMPVAIADIDLGSMVAFGPPGDIDTGCRDDLVTVDGRPVSVRITGAAADAVARRGLALTSCEPVPVDPSDVLVETAPGADTGLDIDQLVFRSPRPVPAGAVPAPVEVVERDDTTLVVDVTPADEARWLVLGQSHNAGWTARLADGTDLGEPVVLDAFANAWLLPAGTGGRVTLRWTPQRVVDAALAASALAVLITLLVAARSRRRPDDSSTLRPGRQLGPERPRLRPPLTPLPTVARRTARRAALAVLVGAWFFLPQWPLAAPALALLALVTLRRPRLGLLSAWAAVAAVGVAGAYVAAAQWHNRYPPDFVWPQQFEAVHVVGVLAILAVGVEVVREAVAAPRLTRERPTPPPPPG